MAQKLEAQGGKGGELWNDGSEYEAVTKILVTVGGNGIQNVKFYYVKEGPTIEGSLRGVMPRTDVPALPVPIHYPCLCFFIIVFITRDQRELKRYQY